MGATDGAPPGCHNRTRVSATMPCAEHDEQTRELWGVVSEKRTKSPREVRRWGASSGVLGSWVGFGVLFLLKFALFSPSIGVCFAQISSKNVKPGISRFS